MKKYEVAWNFEQRPFDLVTWGYLYLKFRQKIAVLGLQCFFGDSTDHDHDGLRPHDAAVGVESGLKEVE